MKTEKSKDAGVKILFAICISVIAVLLAIIGYVAVQVISNEGELQSEIQSLSSEIMSASSGADISSNNKLDPNFSNLMLVNGNNPLPDDYNYTANLVTVEQKYLNGYNNKLDKDVMLYIIPMIEAAWRDGVELYILSPYRSYEYQQTLFQNQVAKQQSLGLNKEDAEQKAATVVARPKTSEHHTGLAVDFNMAEDEFETTEGYKWLLENADDYGFIMRYKTEKQDITGVINEPWHWRFVGINHAKKINQLDMCLEEYVEYLG